MPRLLAAKFGPFAEPSRQKLLALPSIPMLIGRLEKIVAWNMLSVAALCLTGCGGSKELNEYTCDICEEQVAAEEECTDRGEKSGCESASLIDVQFIDGCLGVGDPIFRCEFLNCDQEPTCSIEKNE